MRLIILFLLLPLFASGQTLSKDQQTISLSIGEASRLDYWGRKGIACVPLLDAMEIQIDILRSQTDLHEGVIENFKAAQMEYRSMVERLANSNQDLALKLLDRERELEIYKDRSRRRGQVIAIGSAVVGLLAYIGLKG